MAVLLVLLLFEAAFAQGFQAKVTHKVVGVELGAHGRDAAAQDWLLAGVTHAPAGLVVVGLAQRFAFVLEEAAVDEGGVALLQKGRSTNLKTGNLMSLTVQTHRCISHTRDIELEDFSPRPWVEGLTLHTKHCGCHRALRAEM